MTVPDRTSRSSRTTSSGRPGWSRPSSRPAPPRSGWAPTPTWSSPSRRSCSTEPEASDRRTARPGWWAPSSTCSVIGTTAWMPSDWPPRRACRSWPSRSTMTSRPGSWPSMPVRSGSSRTTSSSRTAPALVRRWFVEAPADETADDPAVDAADDQRTRRDARTRYPAPATRDASPRRRRPRGTAGVRALLIGVGPELEWLTGYEAKPLERLTMLVVPAEGDPAIVTPRLEVAAAEQAPGIGSGGVRIRSWLETEDPVRPGVGVRAGWAQARAWSSRTPSGRPSCCGCRRRSRMPPSTSRARSWDPSGAPRMPPRWPCCARPRRPRTGP